MPRIFTTLLALATLSATAPLFAQSANFAGPGTDSSYTDPNATQPPAPIERHLLSPNPVDNGYPQQGPPPPQGSYNQQRPANHTTEPAQGVWLVTDPNASVQTVSTTADHVELHVEHGRANVNVHHPADHSEILVDLPGGQVSLLKDGLYTFNAETNTVRVLHGEAEVSVNNGKPVKVKEDHQFAFGTNGATGANGSQARAQEADPNQLRADLLQGNYGGGEGYRHGDGYGEGFAGYGPYAYGWPYYGFYGPGWGYPYYAFGGPFGWGYPYGGFGLGFGYYGGFRGGYGGYGFRGGFRR